MRHLDLFSGIGGFALAASWVWGDDHEIVSFCEIEDYPHRVLKKHWPDVPCHGDIKTLRGDSFGAIDLITGGFPCQPFSTAGKQRGSEDDRHLWPEMFRVIQEAKPAWVIGENVAGLLSMVEFEQCFIDLEAKGFEVQAFIIPACGVKAPHPRDRVWIVAHSGENADKKQGAICKDNYFMEKDMQHGVNIWGKHNGACQFDGWNPDRYARDGSAFRGGVHGVPSKLDKNRIEHLGNAIVPQCVVPIMQAIKDVEK